MEPNVVAELIKDYGLGVGLVIIIAALLIMLIKFFLNQWDKMLMREQELLAEATRERGTFYMLINKQHDDHVNSMTELNAAIKEHSMEARNRGDRQEEGHRYQRDEHKEMIGTLSTACGHIAECARILSKINGKT